MPALDERGSLDLRFPDGQTVSGPVVLGERTSGRVTWDGDRPIAGRRVVGPWSDALSQYLGERVELLEAVESRRAIDVAPITILGDGSVARLERELDTRLGTRRFRMTMTLSGLEAHEEDTWYGRMLEIGGCRLRVGGPVPRCAATTHDPRTGVRDHPTLRGIVAYREPIEMPDGSVVKAPFGVYASVERPGPIRVGDPARLLQDQRASVRSRLSKALPQPLLVRAHGLLVPQAAVGEADRGDAVGLLEVDLDQLPRVGRRPRSR